MLKKELALEAILLIAVFLIFSGGLQAVSSKAYFHYQEFCKN